jgi:hypothetical protein
VAIFLRLLAFAVFNLLFYPVWGLDDRFEQPLISKLLKMPRKPNRTIYSFNDSPVERCFSSRPIEMRNFEDRYCTLLDLDSRRKKRRSKLSGSDLINAPVAESSCRQYNRDNADFMMYLWDDRLGLLSIPVMELLNRTWASVQRSCFKSSEAYDKAAVQNTKKAGLIIVLNPAHDPVDFDNLNAKVFADYMVYMVEHRMTVIRTLFGGSRSALYHVYCFYRREYSRTMEIQLWHAMSGMRSRIARCQQERGGRVTSGRYPMPFELY